MKLIDKSALVAEIEKSKAEALQKKSQCKRHGLEKIKHQISAYNKVLSFIDSMQEEPVSEDLEEAVNAYIGYAPEVDESSSTYGKRQAFKAGAQWKEQQLVAKAFKVNISNASIVSLPSDCNLKVGDKVLIIKEY